MPGWLTLAEQVHTPCHTRVPQNICKQVISFTWRLKSICMETPTKSAQLLGSHTDWSVNANKMSNIQCFFYRHLCGENNGGHHSGKIVENHGWATHSWITAFRSGGQNSASLPSRVNFFSWAMHLPGRSCAADTLILEAGGLAVHRQNGVLLFLSSLLLLVFLSSISKPMFLHSKRNSFSLGAFQLPFFSVSSSSRLSRALSLPLLSPSSIPHRPCQSEPFP